MGAQLCEVGEGSSGKLLEGERQRGEEKMEEVQGKGAFEGGQSINPGLSAGAGVGRARGPEGEGARNNSR